MLSISQRVEPDNRWIVYAMSNVGVAVPVQGSRDMALHGDLFAGYIRNRI